MNSTTSWVWTDGEWHLAEDAGHPLQSKALFYGAGCFETLLLRSGCLLHPDLHRERMERGLAWMGVPDLQMPDLKGAFGLLGEVARTSGMSDSTGSYRIQASLLGGRGYGDMKSVPVQLTMTTSTVHEPRPAVRLTIVRTRTVPSGCRPADLKLSNTLHYMKAKQEAGELGYDDSILLSCRGNLAETSIANLFWRSGGIVYTPSPDCHILPGIMRSVVWKCLDKMGVPVVEGQFRPRRLERAEEVWVTNSLVGIQPVEAVGDTLYRTRSDFYRSMSETFRAYFEQHRHQI
jgi:branched-subunit amino acid aminotransferase/4-amino-4-deoxychorismate lyase